MDNVYTFRYKRNVKIGTTPESTSTQSRNFYLVCRFLNCTGQLRKGYSCFMVGYGKIKPYILMEINLASSYRIEF